MSYNFVTLSTLPKTEIDGPDILRYIPGGNRARHRRYAVTRDTIPSNGRLYVNAWHLNDGMKEKSQVYFLLLLDESVDISPPHRVLRDQHTAQITQVMAFVARVCRFSLIDSVALPSGNFMAVMHNGNLAAFKETFLSIQK